MQPAANEGAELDFGQERRMEAQLMLRATLSHATQNAYAGQCKVAGVDELPPLLTEDAAPKHFTKALQDFCKAKGCSVSVGSTWASQGEQEPGPTAPFEAMTFVATMPATASTDKLDCHAMMIEACAELTRALLDIAIDGAKADLAGPEDGVLVVFKVEPQIKAVSHFETGKLAAAVAVQVLIACKTELRVNYLLGSVATQKAHGIHFDIPLVEVFYGPNRLRFLDARVADEGVGVTDGTPKLQVAS